MSASRATLYSTINQSIPLIFIHSVSYLFFVAGGIILYLSERERESERGYSIAETARDLHSLKYLEVLWLLLCVNMCVLYMSICVCGLGRE